MARKSKKRKSKKSRARKRSGLTVATRSGKRSRARKRSGFDKQITSWRDALVASGTLRFGSGGVYALMRKNNYDFPMSRVLLPAGVAFAAGQGYIPLQGMFGIAVDQAFNGIVDTTDWLRKLMDWRFLDAKTNPQPVPGKSGAPSARQLADTRLRINAMDGLSYMREGLTVDPSDRSGAANPDEYRR